MDFIVGLPNTSGHHDSIWIIMDQLTKVAHFLPVHTTNKAQKYAKLYIDRIVCLHGLPRTIVSDRGAQFVARFWEKLQEILGTKLIRSSAYHPQTDDCNLTDGEYMLIPKQGAIHEEDQEPTPEPATEDLPAAPAFEAKPHFYA